MARNRAWSLVAEGLVVVASILVAFALDAWWDSSRNAGDLRLELTNVAAELESNRAALGARLDGHGLIVASIDEILTRIEGRSADGTVVLEDSLLFRAFVTSPTTDPSTGALDALIASGRISLLDDIGLRSFLAGFRNQIVDMGEDELGARTVAHEKVFPLFAAHPAGELGAAVYLGDGEAGETVFPGEAASIRFPPERWTEVRSTLSLRRFWLLNAISEGVVILTAMDEAVAALQGEIDGL